MKKTTLIFVIAIFFLASCSITQEYHFNKDFSGNYKMEMDLGDMITMIKAMDTTGNMNGLDTLDQSFKELSHKYEKAGATNVNAGWNDDKTTIMLSFDFADVDALNMILENTSGDESIMDFASKGDTTKFKNKGTKFLSVDLPEFKNDTSSLASLEQIKDYLTIETIFSFDRTIKKINNENAKLSSDKKSISFETKLEDMKDENFTMDTEIKLKRK